MRIFYVNAIFSVIVFIKMFFFAIFIRTDCNRRVCQTRNFTMIDLETLQEEKEETR